MNTFVYKFYIAMNGGGTPVNPTTEILYKIQIFLEFGKDMECQDSRTSIVNSTFVRGNYKTANFIEGI
jgi:hypothetical protein